MSVIIIRNDNEESSLINQALSANPLNRIINSGLKYHFKKMFGISPKIYVAGRNGDNSAAKKILNCKDSVSIKSISKNNADKKWFVVLNGTHFPILTEVTVNKILDIDADVIFLNITPSLSINKEKVCTTASKQLAGFRRIFEDCIEHTPLPINWPQIMLIRRNNLGKIFDDCEIEDNFELITDRLSRLNLNIKSFNVGGKLTDLNNPNDLMWFCFSYIDSNNNSIENIIQGDNVKISDESIVLGPSILCDNSKIEINAIVDSCIIMPSAVVTEKKYLSNSIVLKNETSNVGFKNHNLHKSADSRQNFRTWPIFSYPGLFKRMVDIVVSLFVLILFAPFFPIIALLVKLSSSGPVFFKDRRQGLHGKSFDCLKFRSMMTGADEMQEKLRLYNQADGPQFKMEDDPRITLVGRFLRETFLDEIPQFINVFLGQMSTVGPRPSPEKENTLCPMWRDARLSVRPGISGFWQVYRTRQPMRDFQEWIYYDIKYVRELSFKTDIVICWITLKKMVLSFVKQF